MKDLKAKEQDIRDKLAQAAKNAPKKKQCKHKFPEHNCKENCFCLILCSLCGAVQPKNA